MRMSFSRQKEVQEMPNLIEVQKSSYRWFLEEGLQEAFDDISPIEDYNGHLSLSFVGYRLCEDEIKYDIEKCKERDATYAAPLKVRVRLYDKENDQTVTEQEIFMGDMPVMTDNGTFVINGAERVVVSQLVRSPGIYYGIDKDKFGKEMYSCTVIPNRGAWLEYETDVNDVFWVRVDRTRKVPVTVLLRALGLGTDDEIFEVFGDEPKLRAALSKDPSDSYETGLLELYKKIRPGEPLSVESADSLINAMLFDPRRYDLAKVGRYKFNKKLALRNRIVGHVLAEDVVDEANGEILGSAGETVTREMADAIQNAAIPSVVIQTEERNVKVLSNLMVDITHFVDCNPEELGIHEQVYYPALREILLKYQDNEDPEALADALKKSVHELIPKHITKEDILASINYNMHLEYGIGNADDIDHLGNRRIRCVGELLQNQYRIGLSRLERVVRERMTTHDPKDPISPQTLINIKPVQAAVKEFFGSSQLSQFMDQNNPLSEITHKRRLSALGPGGLSRDRAGLEVRDIHYTHYGRMCPIETPEGPNIGLISYLTSYAKINEYGFIETPYRKVVDGHVTNDVKYMAVDEEYDHIIAQANEIKGDHLAGKKVVARVKGETVMVDASTVDYADVSPRQIVSVATACVPFLENDDCTRALMGANMQRQAVPLLNPHSAYVGTGMEHAIAHDSGAACVATAPGVVTFVDASKVVVTEENGKEDVYNLVKFQRSNSSTCLNQRPIVWDGEKIDRGDILADGPAMYNGELALGQNVLVAFMTWHGYNYEDAIIMSERMQYDDVYTSVHIEEYSIEVRETKLGDEKITRDIPNVGENAKINLDARGVVRVGAEVKEGDILVGKVTPKGQSEVSPQEKLLLAIFGEKSKEVRDNSLKVPHGGAGIVQSIRRFTKEQNHDLPAGVKEVIKVYVAQKRKISEGDKMAGRHGNKGVISRINPVEDMPFMADGTPIDIMLNPFGVPSRMNIGQVLELHLGMAARALNVKFATPVFDGVSNQDLKDIMAEAKVSPDGKYVLYDGQTGEAFDERIAVGVMYMIKLAHMVDDKLHARATGPYSLVTQQPLGGKAQNGGQRFGEMEVWALEAYGAAHTLQEILTIKSDDIDGRTNTYSAILNGKDLPEPGVPESFRVLVHELMALALDVRMVDTEGNEKDLKQLEKEELDQQTERDVRETHAQFLSSLSDIEAQSSGLAINEVDSSGELQEVDGPAAVGVGDEDSSEEDE